MDYEEITYNSTKTKSMPELNLMKTLNFSRQVFSGNWILKHYNRYNNGVKPQKHGQQFKYKKKKKSYFC